MVLKGVSENSTTPRKQNIVLFLFCVFALVLFGIWSNYLHTFQRNHISSDVVEYYSFVPAAFECNDLSFSSDCPKYYWAQTTVDGKHVNKRTIGMAYMYVPFYAISQMIAAFQGQQDDGYSKQTQRILVYGIWIYVCIGLFFLGKALYQYFSTRVVITVLFLIIAATNLIWYTNGEPLFAHGVNFMWLCILIYSTIAYHKQQHLWSLLFISISVSMLAIIRPNNLLFGIFPIVFGVYDRQTLYLKLQMLHKNYGQLILAAVVFLIPIVPQLMYWRYATGHWIYYSYQGEKFYWDRPLILNVLFSFRKGWLVYTPVMSLAIIGMFALRHKLKELILPVVFMFGMFLYITSCWWAWSYGGCFGMRPMIDIYPLLAFPIGAIIMKRSWLLQITLMSFLSLCTWLNVFQAWQYREGIIHFDQMNKEVYCSVWRMKKYPNDYDLMLSYPDYLKELSGKGSYFDLNELSSDVFTMKFIRAQYVCVADTNDMGITASHQYASSCGAYIFVLNSFERKFLIRSTLSGNYWTLNKGNGFIECMESDPLKADLFEINSLGRNKFAIKAPNNFYLTSTESNQFKLKADALDINPAAYVVIRKYVP